jgi:hypothetical protein
MRPSTSATKRIAAPSPSDSASSPYQSQKPVPERTDPGDAECQSDGKGSENKRYAVADHVISQLKEHGDPWKLCEEARPKGGVYCSPVLRHSAGLIQAANFRSAVVF